MPSTSSKDPVQDNASDDNDVFDDAQPPADPPLPPTSNFKELIRRKNTYAKGRITLAQNYLNTLEARQVSTLRQVDTDIMDQHINTMQKAIQAVLDIIESSNHLMSPQDIEAYLLLIDYHTPRISDIISRTSAIKDHVMHNTTLPPPTLAQPSSIPVQSSKKIDKTFCPDALDEDATPAMFDQWLKQFKVFIDYNNLKQAPLEQHRLLINMCLTPAMAKTLSRACSADNASTMDEIISKLEAYILNQTSLMTRRYHFFNCVQNESESIRQYIVRFRGIGDYANFEGLSYEDMMACRLVTGVRDEHLRRELLRLSKSDFHSINTFATSWETSHSNAAQMDPPSDVQSSVAKISAYRSEKKKAFRNNMQASSQSSQPSQGTARPRSSSRSTFTPTESNPCRNCGLTSHPQSGCQAWDQQCSFCKIVGHFARACRKKQRAIHQGRAVRNIEEDQSHQSTQIFHHPETDDSGEQAVSTIFSLTAPQLPKPSKPTPKIMAAFSLGDKHVGDAWILPDTGAAVSVLPQSLVTYWGILRDVSPNDTPLKSVDGSSVACFGSITMSVTVQGSKALVVFFVCPKVNTVIMSWHALLQIGIVPRYFPNIDIDYISLNQVQQSHMLHHSIKKNVTLGYPKVFSNSQKLKCMNGDPMHIYLKKSIDWPNVKQVYKPRPIPVPLREATKCEIDSMVAKNIIKPVTTPTMFTSPLVVIPKKGNKVRLVVDYTELNRYVRRPVHPFPSVLEVKTMIPSSAKFFATLDALQGYWQIPLQPQSQLLTTFLTPWGRFCFTRAPMGLASSGDEFCRRGDEAFKHIDGVIKVVDDLLVYASNEKELESKLHKVMKAAENAGITLSAEKFNVGTSVSFIGLNITSDGIKPDPKHTQAIIHFPIPKNRTDLRLFLRLVNQFGSFSKSIATLSKSLRPLLSLSSDWQWTNDHNEAFQSLKNTLAQAPILKYFDPRLQTRLVTDASKLNGLGYALLQQHKEGWALISCGSRYVTSTEANYAIVELEALAIAWAVNKCRIYLMGLPNFDVITDHRPLVSIFNSTRLTHDENPRLFRIMQQVTAYNFLVHWTPGKLHSAPDALSRSPINVATIDDSAAEDDNTYIDPALQELVQHSNACQQYMSFRKALATFSLSQIKKLPLDTHGHIRAYSSVWDRLSVHKNSGLILLDSHKVFVPQSYRSRLLSLVHASHQGISRTKARMQALYFWQGMSNDIVQLLQACDLCHKFKNSQPEQPIEAHSVPVAPFRAVSCDLFDYRGSHTLTMVDRFSGFPLVAHFNKAPTSLQLMKVMSSFFKDFGLPTSIRHDGAKPFVSTVFKQFMHTHNIKDELSSAYNPRSNGHAEASVKAIKLLVKKCWQNRQLNDIAFNNALLEWRNTPRYPANLSPAQLLFGRNLRSLLPAISYGTVSHSDIKKAVKQNYQYIKSTYQSFNCRKAHLRPLSLNDQVRIQDPVSKLWDKTGIVTQIRQGGLSYFIECQGKIYLRNRKYLKKCYAFAK